MKVSDYRPGILEVYDDVLRDPQQYRAAALASEFKSVVAGPDVFHGLAACTDPFLGHLVEAILPDGACATLSFFRRSPVGQDEPNYVHSDRDMGDWTAILYLNPDPPLGDGTSFWAHRASQSVAGSMDGLDRDLAGWECWHHVPAKFNRMLLFRADLFHSRALAENYGEGETARLIQIVFGRGAMVS